MSRLPPSAKTLFELPLGTCLWPCSDAGWCGKPTVDGRAYCAKHQRASIAKDQRNLSSLAIDRTLRQKTASQRRAVMGVKPSAA
jgi:hypothetical protein